jgi:hypothetical protein
MSEKWVILLYAQSPSGTEEILPVTHKNEQGIRVMKEFESQQSAESYLFGLTKDMKYPVSAKYVCME